MPGTRLRRRWAWVALAAGLAAPVLLLVHEMTALGIGPVELARLWLIAAAGGHLSPWTAVAGGLFAAAGLAAARAILARPPRNAAAPPPQQRPSTRGPAGYYGPGSLGGTESALRR
jgi:hypothetical protein